MNYSKNYRILTLDGHILGYRSTKQKAVDLALQQADRLKESIEVQKRNTDGEYEQITMAMNPEKFSWEEGDIEFL
jgi:hypothetical protein